MRAHRTLVMAIGVFVVVLLSLQIFLLMIGLEALLSYDAPLAWTAAITSVVLGGTSALLYRYLRRPSTTAPRVGSRQPRSTSTAGPSAGTGRSDS